MKINKKIKKKKKKKKKKNLFRKFTSHSVKGLKELGLDIDKAGANIKKNLTKTATTLKVGIDIAIKHGEDIGVIVGTAGDIMILAGTLTGQPEIVAAGASVKLGGKVIRIAGKKAKAAQDAVQRTTELGKNVALGKNLKDSITHAALIIQDTAIISGDEDLLAISKKLNESHDHIQTAINHIDDIKAAHGKGDMSAIIKGISGTAQTIDNVMLSVIKVQEERENRMLLVLEQIQSSQDAQLVLEKEMLNKGPFGNSGIIIQRSGAVSPFDSEETITDEDSEDEEKAEEKAEELNKVKSNKDAQQLIFNTFTRFIKTNPKIKLDEAILLFENAKQPSLETFAKSKNRLASSYRDIYRAQFNTAKTKFLSTKITSIKTSKQRRKELLAMGGRELVNLTINEDTPLFAFKIDQLKVIARSQGLFVSGLKSELVARIKENFLHPDAPKKKRKKRPPSKYNRYMSKAIKSGIDFNTAAKAWKTEKFKFEV